ncbi:MAG TPA: tol-pal system protein YbgF [Devosia sp.]|nr:tol-pal system protein YbgF [Devosia sp.]
MTFAVVFLSAGLAPQWTSAQSQLDAQLTVRVQQLEEQVRDLTGQIQGLQFTLTQMQEQLQKMQDDNEFRFQQLEGGNAGAGKGGAGKKTDAATQAGDATPAGALPPAPQGEQTSSADAGGALGENTGNQSAAAGEAGAAQQPMDSDGLGESADPLVGKGGGTAELGTLPADVGSQPLNLSLDSSQELTNGDAAAQYQAGYDAIVRGDYAFAEDQFRQFIALYPKDPQAPDATNWLGEALLQRQAYDEAADVLLTGFQNYEKSPRAPDLLMKLGIALGGAGEQETACRTFAEVAKRYPNQPAAFKQRLEQERQREKCPA